MWTYLLIILSFEGVAHSVILHDYKFQNLCGKTIIADIGIVEFTSYRLPSYLPNNECQVTIKPSTPSLQFMFYFEEFSMPVNCTYAWLKFTRVGRNGETTVPGLRNYLCGNNKTLTLTDHNFITSVDDNIIITYNYSDTNRRPNVYFNIVFVVFHTNGSCNADHEYECSNGRCVEKAYHCSRVIKACPILDEECTEPVGADPVISVLKGIGWILLVLVAMLVLRFIYIRLRGPLCGGDSKDDQDRSSEDNAENVFLRLEEIQEGDRRTSPADAEQTDSDEQHNVSNSNHHTLTNGAPPPSVLPSNEIQIVPSAPPPTYDDVMTTSYPEVSSNQDRHTQS